MINPEKRFNEQRRSAKRRGVEFRLTFEEWWDFWSIDNRWSRRGRAKGELVMARIGDRGAYAVGNIICLTSEGNLADGKDARVASIKAGYADGSRRTPAPLMCKGYGHPRSKAVLTPRGQFGSAALAAQAYGLDPSSATLKARTNWKGWCYV